MNSLKIVDLETFKKESHNSRVKGKKKDYAYELFELSYDFSVWVTNTITYSSNIKLDLGKLIEKYYKRRKMNEN